jgi:hypothetical protein
MNLKVVIVMDAVVLTLMGGVLTEGRRACQRSYCFWLAPGHMTSAVIALPSTPY